MNRRPVPLPILVSLALSLALALSGCGNKGALVLPDKPATETPAEGSTPADSAPSADEDGTPARR